MKTALGSKQLRQNTSTYGYLRYGDLPRYADLPTLLMLTLPQTPPPHEALRCESVPLLSLKFEPNLILNVQTSYTHCE